MEWTNPVYDSETKKGQAGRAEYELEVDTIVRNQGSNNKLQVGEG